MLLASHVQAAPVVACSRRMCNWCVKHSMLCRQMHTCLLILRLRWAQCTSTSLMHRYAVPYCKLGSWLTDGMLCQSISSAGCSSFKLATSLQPSLVVMLQHISFTLQSNSSTNWFKGHYQNPTTYFQLPLQMAAERETARHLANGKSLTCAFGNSLLAQLLI